MAIPFACLLVSVLLLLIPSAADIRYGSIHSNDRLIVPFGVFGFTDSGHLELNVSFFSLSNPNADLSKLGFFLTTRQSWLRVVDQLERSDIDCPLHSNLLHAVFPLRELNRNGTSSFSLQSDVGHGRFHLTFANCIAGVRVSMNVRSEFYNVNGDHREYLSAGMEKIPGVYVFFSMLYLALLFTAIFLLCFKKRIPTPMHMLVFAVIVFKVMSLLYDAENKSFLNTTGRSHVQNMDVSVYCWMIVKFPLLMLPHSAVIPVGDVDIDISGPKFLIPLEILVLLFNALLICAGLLGMTLWIKCQEEAARKDTREAEKLKNLEFLRAYCYLTMSLMYLITVVVYALEFMTDYRYMWTSAAAAEFITLGFYLSVAYRYMSYFV